MTELRKRFKAFKRRSLFDVNLVVLFLDVVYLPVRPQWADRPVKSRALCLPRKAGIRMNCGRQYLRGSRTESPGPL